MNVFKKFLSVALCAGLLSAAGQADAMFLSKTFWKIVTTFFSFDSSSSSSSSSCTFDAGDCTPFIPAEFEEQEKKKKLEEKKIEDLLKALVKNSNDLNEKIEALGGKIKGDEDRLQELRLEARTLFKEKKELGNRCKRLSRDCIEKARSSNRDFSRERDASIGFSVEGKADKDAANVQYMKMCNSKLPDHLLKLRTVFVELEKEKLNLSILKGCKASVDQRLSKVRSLLEVKS